MSVGRFITFEGGEGAGKSTQVRRLAERLREARAGRVVLTTREPGGAPGAEEIRGLLINGDASRWDAMSEALLHFAARREHLVRTIWPALAQGQWVVCDRFADSSLAYQGYGQGLGREAIAALYALAVGDFRPDLTLILDLPVEEGLRRAGKREGGLDRYERMDGAFHHRLRRAFLDVAQQEPERCRLIDAAAGEDLVAARVWEAVAGHFGLYP